MTQYADDDCTSQWEKMAAQERERAFADRLGPIKRKARRDRLLLGGGLMTGGGLAILIGMVIGIGHLFQMENLTLADLETLRGTGSFIFAGLITIAAGWTIWRER
jgi:hypothetical protein